MANGPVMTLRSSSSQRLQDTPNGASELSALGVCPGSACPTKIEKMTAVGRRSASVPLFEQGLCAAGECLAGEEHRCPRSLLILHASMCLLERRLGSDKVTKFEEHGGGGKGGKGKGAKSSWKGHDDRSAWVLCQAAFGRS